MDAVYCHVSGLSVCIMVCIIPDRRTERKETESKCPCVTPLGETGSYVTSPMDLYICVRLIL